MLVLAVLMAALLLSGCALPGAPKTNTANATNAPSLPVGPPAVSSPSPPAPAIPSGGAPPAIRTTDLNKYRASGAPAECRVDLGYGDKPATLFLMGERSRLLAPLVQEGVLIKIDAIMSPEGNYFNVQEFGITNASPCTWLKVDAGGNYKNQLAMAAQSVDNSQFDNLPAGAILCKGASFGAGMFSTEGRVCTLSEVLQRQAAAAGR